MNAPVATPFRPTQMPSISDERGRTYEPKPLPSLWESRGDEDLRLSAGAQERAPTPVAYFRASWGGPKAAQPSVFSPLLRIPEEQPKLLDQAYRNETKLAPCFLGKRKRLESDDHDESPVEYHRSSRGT